jgi:hypothetical protein
MNNPTLVLHNLHNIIQRAVHCGADLGEDFGGDVAAFAHLGDGGRADAGLGAKVFLLHILIDQHFPELLITDCHKGSPPDKQNVPCRLAGH